MDRWSVAVRMPKTPRHFPPVVHLSPDFLAPWPFPLVFGAGFFASCGFPPFAMTMLLASRGTKKVKATIALDSSGYDTRARTADRRIQVQETKESAKPQPLPHPDQGATEQRMADAPERERGTKSLLLVFKSDELSTPVARRTGLQNRT